MAVLKITKGKNMKGNTKSVSSTLMRSHGLCQSLQEQADGAKDTAVSADLLRISALTG